jgi:hypothetical protein
MGYLSGIEGNTEMMQARFHKLNLKLRNEENKKSFSFFFRLRQIKTFFSMKTASYKLWFRLLNLSSYLYKVLSSISLLFSTLLEAKFVHKNRAQAQYYGTQKYW